MVEGGDNGQETKKRTNKHKKRKRTNRGEEEQRGQGLIYLIMLGRIIKGCEGEWMIARRTRETATF